MRESRCPLSGIIRWDLTGCTVDEAQHPQEDKEADPDEGADASGCAAAAERDLVAGLHARCSLRGETLQEAQRPG